MLKLLAMSVVTSVGALVAQKMPDPHDGAAEIQLHVVDRLVGDDGLDALLGPVPEAPEAAVAGRRERLAVLCRALRLAVLPASADPTCLQPLGNGVIVLRGTAQQQVALTQVLRYWSKLGRVGSTVRARSFSVTEAGLTPALREALGVPMTGADDCEVVLTPEQWRRVGVLLANAAGVEALEVRHLHVTLGAAEAVPAKATVYYRKDYLVELVDGKPKAWPVTGELADGLSFAVRAAPLDAEKSVVQVDASWASVQRPIPTFKTSLGAGGGKVEIDLPESEIRAFDGRYVLRREQVGVLLSREREDGSRRLVLVDVVDG